MLDYCSPSLDYFQVYDGMVSALVRKFHNLTQAALELERLPSLK